MTHAAYMAQIAARLPGAMFFFFLLMVFKSIAHAAFIGVMIALGTIVVGIVGIFIIALYTAERDRRKKIDLNSQRRR